MKKYIAFQCIQWWGLLGIMAVVSGPIYSQEALPAADQSVVARLRVRDAKDAPIAQAVVTITLTDWMTGDSIGVSLRELTDTKGEAQFNFPAAGTRTSSYRLTVEHDGYLPHQGGFIAFRGALIEQQITLSKPVVTRIRILNAQGEPVRGVNVLLRHPLDGYQHDWNERTDAEGEAVFTHPPFTQPFELMLGGTIKKLDDQPRLTVRLTDQELQAIVPSRRVSGKVLLPNGQPAAGWFIAPHALFTGSGGAIGSPPTTSYTASELFQVPTDGSFTTELAEDQLFIVSPDGIPFLYPLNLRSWTEEPRHLTVRIPAVRRTWTGQLVKPDGQPAKNVEIAVNEIRSGSRLWRLNIGEPYRRECVLPSQATAANGARVGRIASDGQGHYQLPFYFGSQIEYLVTPPYLHFFRDFEDDQRIVLKSIESKQAERAKKITLRCKDEQGHLIPNMQVKAYQGETKGKVVENSGGSYADGRGGQAFFVRTNLDRIVATLQASNWNTWKTNFAVRGPDDETFTLTVPEKFHQRPLEGVILAPDGKPVVGATVSFEPPNSGLGIRLWARTDARGQFHFEHAPDAGTLHLYRRPEDGGPLPGYTETPQVTALERNLTIQLQAGGSVEVLLPAGLKTPRHLHLRGETKNKKADYYSLTGDTNRLQATYLRPGIYQVLNTDPRTFGAVSNVTVVVRAGENSELDLSDAQYRPSEAAPRQWTTVKISHEGHPFGGALVSVFADQADWREREIADLSNDAGQVRFRGDIGRRYVVVARMPGRFIGWSMDTLASNQMLSIELRPVRTLVVKLDPQTGTRAASRI